MVDDTSLAPRIAAALARVERAEAQSYLSEPDRLCVVGAALHGLWYAEESTALSEALAAHDGGLVQLMQADSGCRPRKPGQPGYDPDLDDIPE